MPAKATIDKGSTVLILCDFDNDLVHSNGKFAAWSFPEVERRNVIPNTKKLLTAAREAGLPVIHVKVCFRPGMAGIPQNAQLWQDAGQAEALIEGTWGTEIHEEVRPEAGEIVVVKRRVSAFYHTDLHVILAAYGTATIILCGVATNYAVEGTARDAADAGYFVIIAKDCCSTDSEAAHQASLDSLAQLATISDSDNIINMLM